MQFAVKRRPTVLKASYTDPAVRKIKRGMGAAFD